MPHIFIPRHELFFRVEALPLLGSGKLDLRAVNALAARLAAGTEEASAH
jgi:acyl-[acyl-carrier-protein]-phospholipid O-acyltransferase/long-chain-fatty-acid--[acyl-carrier-protein] ligase